MSATLSLLKKNGGGGGKQRAKDMDMRAKVVRLVEDSSCVGQVTGHVNHALHPDLTNQ